MKLDLIKYSLNNLLQRAKRSFLTILSIFIGIMAIFALVSFGQGLSQYVDQIADEMGRDKIIIQPQGFINPVDSPFTYTEDDLDFVEKIRGVHAAVGMIMVAGEVQQELDEKSVYSYVMGLSLEKERWEIVKEMLTVELAEGRELKKGDKGKVTVGYAYSQPDKIFKKPIGLGDKFYINEEQVEIVGIYESVGNPEDDKNIYMTEEGVIDVLGAEREYGMIVIRAAVGVNPSELAEEIEDEFRDHKGQEEGKEEFFVQTFEDLLEVFSNVLGVINSVLILIALISVLVAAVNIMNTMYTAVLERTKEIGIMKATGAKNSDILSVFVFESGVLGLVGSVIGILLGYGIAELGSAIAAGAGYTSLQAAYPLWLIIGSLMFGFLMGAISGLAPAIQASRQKPVDALRYE
jgi:putative ABC transport system permease protein